MRPWIIASVVVLLAVCALAAGLVMSGAVFTSSSQSNIQVSTIGVGDLLDIYSHATDPQGYGGYYIRPDNGAWAATGVDGSLAVNIGGQPLQNEKIYCIFTLRAESPLPAGITSVSVRATLLPDAGGTQPISKVGFASLGSTARQNPMTLTAGQKVQCNVTVNLPKPWGATYTARIVLTVTYSGYTGTYYQYSVPFMVKADQSVNLLAPADTPASSSTSDTSATSVTTAPTETTAPAVTTTTSTTVAPTDNTTSTAVAPTETTAPSDTTAPSSGSTVQ